MNEEIVKRRNENFNQIVSVLKEIYEDYNFCQLDVCQKERQNITLFPEAYTVIDNDEGKETVVTLTFR